jgi:hypothetical protein
MTAPMMATKKLKTPGTTRVCGTHKTGQTSRLSLTLAPPHHSHTRAHTHVGLCGDSDTEQDGNDLGTSRDHPKKSGLGLVVAKSGDDSATKVGDAGLVASRAEGGGGADIRSERATSLPNGTPSTHPPFAMFAAHTPRANR